jgi:hypothetical protein
MSLQAIRNTWDSPELLRARFRTAKNWLDGEEKLEGNALAVADFLEQLGSYYKLGAIPTNALWDTYSVHIEYYYCIFENQIKEYRTNRDDQTLYSDIEAAYNAMKRISAQKGAPSDGISDANRIAFLRDEMLFAKSEINISV